jgi:hypothetical protein
VESHELHCEPYLAPLMVPMSVPLKHGLGKSSRTQSQLYDRGEVACSSRWICLSHLAHKRDVSEAFILNLTDTSDFPSSSLHQ